MDQCQVVLLVLVAVIVYVLLMGCGSQHTGQDHFKQAEKQMHKLIIRKFANVGMRLMNQWQSLTDFYVEVAQDFRSASIYSDGQRGSTIHQSSLNANRSLLGLGGYTGEFSATIGDDTFTISMNDQNAPIINSKKFNVNFIKVDDRHFVYDVGSFSYGKDSSMNFVECDNSDKKAELYLLVMFVYGFIVRSNYGKENLNTIAMLE